MTSKMGVHRGARHTPNQASGSWKQDGICDVTDFHLFFGRDGESKAARLIREERAKEICRMCPAVEACLAFALEGNEAAGVWGGLGEDERKTERRRQMRSAAAQAARARQAQDAEQARQARRAAALKRPTGAANQPNPERDLMLLRVSEDHIADGGSVTSAAREMKMSRSTLSLARTRASKRLAGVS